MWYDNNAAENGVQIHGDIAITMGNVYLQNAAGDEVVVDVDESQDALTVKGTTKAERV